MNLSVLQDMWLKRKTIIFMVVVALWSYANCSEMCLDKAKAAKGVPADPRLTRHEQEPVLDRHKNTRGKVRRLGRKWKKEPEKTPDVPKWKARGEVGGMRSW